MRSAYVLICALSAALALPLRSAGPQQTAGPKRRQLAGSSVLSQPPHGPAPSAALPYPFITASSLPIFDPSGQATKLRPTTTHRSYMTTVHSYKTKTPPRPTNGKSRPPAPGPMMPAPPSGCFPSINSAMPIPGTPATASSLQNWWCDQSQEYAFMGFSYDLTACPSLDQLNSDFKNMKVNYGARYVRMYSNCDSAFDTYNNVVQAAANNGLGVLALVWFGFDGSDAWKQRLSDIERVVKTNPLAPYVIRSITIGSEPLFDQVLSEQDIANVILKSKADLAQYGMQVSLSDLPYGYQSNNNAPDVFAAVDVIELNVLPFFDSDATTGGKAWPSVSWAISYGQQQGGTTKPLRLTQTGWPSNQDVWKANSDTAVSSISSERGYFDMLDSHCQDFKSMSVGWFAHIYEDNTLPGWGVLQNGQPKFPFAPRTTC